MEYIYCDEVSFTEQSATELLQIADKYGVPPLKELCEEILSESLTVTNVIDLGILADKMEANELIKRIVKFVKRNLNAIFEHDDIRRLPKTILYDLYKLK